MSVCAVFDIPVLFDNWAGNTFLSHQVSDKDYLSVTLTCLFTKVICTFLRLAKGGLKISFLYAQMSFTL